MVCSLIGTRVLAGIGRSGPMWQAQRFKTYYKSGAIKPMPKVLPFGILSLFASVIPGLFVGAAISKSVANFLEENDLFVPEEDDDED